jgi:hypothetical protein
MESINYRYKSKLDNAISDVIEYILSLDYGTLIPFEKLSVPLGYNLEDEKEKRRFRNTMSRIKNFLIEKGYVLRTITGKGYYIMKPKQISGYCYHTYICKMDKLLMKSERTLIHVDKSQLSQTRKTEHKEVKTLNSALRENTDTTIRSSNYYEHKSFYDALKD